MISNIYNYVLTVTIPYRDYFYIWRNNLLYKKPAKRINQDSTLYLRILSYMKEPIQITDNIYLGHILNASNFNKLKELNIDIIVNVTCEISNYYEDDFEYYNIFIKDELDSQFNDEIDNCISFMNKNKSKNILVHCSQGRSRSVTIIVAYLMKYNNISFEQAYNYIKSKKDIINMNVNFKNLLKNNN